MSRIVESLYRVSGVEKLNEEFYATNINWEDAETASEMYDWDLGEAEKYFKKLPKQVKIPNKFIDKYDEYNTYNNMSDYLYDKYEWPFDGFTITDKTDYAKKLEKRFEKVKAQIDKWNSGKSKRLFDNSSKINILEATIFMSTDQEDHGTEYEYFVGVIYSLDNNRDRYATNFSLFNSKDKYDIDDLFDADPEYDKLGPKDTILDAFNGVPYKKLI